MAYAPIFLPMEEVVAAQHYLLPDEAGRRIVYTYIRKNACTAFKRHMIESTGQAAWDAPAIRTLRVPPAVIEAGDLDISIFVHRDPFERAVSTFLNKFVALSGAEDVLASYTAQTGRDPDTASFTQVLDYLRGGIARTDCHFWPQKAHLARGRYTHPIALPSLPSAMANILGPSNRADVFASRHNATRYGAGGADEDLSGTPAATLRAMIAKGGLPLVAGFATGATCEVVRYVYRFDFDMISELSGGSFIASL